VQQAPQIMICGACCTPSSSSLQPHHYSLTASQQSSERIEVSLHQIPKCKMRKSCRCTSKDTFVASKIPVSTGFTGADFVDCRTDMFTGLEPCLED